MRSNLKFKVISGLIVADYQTIFVELVWPKMSNQVENLRMRVILSERRNNVWMEEKRVRSGWLRLPRSEQATRWAAKPRRLPDE